MIISELMLLIMCIIMLLIVDRIPGIKPYDFDFDKYLIFKEKLLELTHSNKYVKNIYINVDKDVKLDTWYIVNPHSKTTIFFLHKFSTNCDVTSYFNMIYFMYPFSSFIIMDYRNFGNSSVGINRTPEIMDIMAVWNFYIQNYNIDPNNVVVMSESDGCNLLVPFIDKLTKLNIKPKALILNFPSYFTENIFHIPTIIADSDKKYSINTNKNVKHVNIQSCDSIGSMIVNDDYIYSITSYLQ